MLKRLFTIILSSVLMLVSAMPVFAAPPPCFVMTLIIGEGTDRPETMILNVANGSPCSSFPQPIYLKGDYMFAGWSVDDDGTVDYDEIEIQHFIPDHDMIFYAVYLPTVIVTCHAGEGFFNVYSPGESPEFQTLAYIQGRGRTSTRCVPFIDDPAREFAGWATHPGGEIVYTDLNLFDFRPYYPMDLYAVYAPAVYVTFRVSRSGTISEIESPEMVLTDTPCDFVVKVPKGYPSQTILNLSLDAKSEILYGWQGDDELIEAEMLRHKVFNEDSTFTAVFGPINPPSAYYGPEMSVHVKVGQTFSFQMQPLESGRSPMFITSVNTTDHTIAAAVHDGLLIRIFGVEEGTTELCCSFLSQGGYTRSGYVPIVVEKNDDPAGGIKFGFNEYKGKKYWFENWVRQGIKGDPKNITDTVFGYERGREIYDPESDGWYWLDAIYDGAKAESKEVWMPYLFQDDLLKGANKEGKWVRYDADGKMIKGWYTVFGADAALYPEQAGNTYCYDLLTGQMCKGYWTIGDEIYHFDETTGVLIR
ncbi:MAG: InlB B-repeat-containing protein [Solobacterium sp.]|nr:InlB B-repeat-containing protein [Solobacterium sp.]